MSIASGYIEEYIHRSVRSLVAQYRRNERDIVLCWNSGRDYRVIRRGQSRARDILGVGR